MRLSHVHSHHGWVLWLATGVLLGCGGSPSAPSNPSGKKKDLVELVERDLKELPVKDLDAFQRGRAAREAIRSKATAADRERLDGAEADWTKRAVAAYVSEMNAIMEEQPDVASAQLRRWAGRLKACGSYPDCEKELLSARRQAVQAYLTKTRRCVIEAVTQGRFVEAVALVETMRKNLDGEEDVVGLGEAVTRQADEVGFLADLARLAEPTSPKPGSASPKTTP